MAMTLYLTLLTAGVANTVSVPFLRAGNFRTLFIGKKMCVGFDFC